MKKKGKDKSLVVDVKRYGGEQIVIYRNRIIATGATAREALESAHENHPAVPPEELTVFAVPETVYTMYGIS